MTNRLPTVLIIGGASECVGVQADLARAAGEYVACSGANLLTGGRSGVMEVAARAFASTASRAGRSIAVLPGKIPELPAEPSSLSRGATYSYTGKPPNESVEIAVRTHLPGDNPRGEGSRNFINVLSADLVIALSGGKGTEAELDIARALGKPVVALLGPDLFIGEYTAATLPKGTASAEDAAALARRADPYLAPFLLPRPAFADLRGAYSTDPGSVHPCTITFPNTCAIRMSEALAASMPGVVDKFRASGLNICPHGYMRGAQDLAAVLRRGDVFGNYNQGFSAPGQAPASMQGRKGIVCYMNIPTYPDGQGHIDLWDGTGPVGGAYWTANPIWFWHLQ